MTASGRMTGVTTGTLVLLRHGESEWNKANLFTGWVDVPLSDKGRQEAARGGQLLTEHGQEVIAESRAHVLDYELSMVAWFSGCVIRAVPTEDGCPTCCTRRC